MYKTTRSSAQVKMSRGLKAISTMLLSSLLMTASFIFFASESYAQTDSTTFGSGGIFQLEKQSNAPAEVSAGDSIIYTVTLKSSLAITGGTLTDTMTLNPNLSLNGAVTANASAGSIAPINTLVPFNGDGQPVIAPLFAPQTDIIVIPANGQIDYIIPAIASSSVTTDTVITNTVEYTHPALSKLLTVVVTHTVRIPDPVITKTLVAIPAAPPLNVANLAAAGDTVTYLIEYANSGGTGDGAIFTDTLPLSGITGVTVSTVSGPTVSPSSPTVSGDQITMTLPSFPIGTGSFNISFVIPVSATPPIAQFAQGIGSVTNTIRMTVSPTPTAAFTSSDPNLLIQPIADLTFNKQVINNTALAGSTDRVTFTLTITNAGALTASVTITDVVPFSVTNVLADLASTLDSVVFSGEESVMTFITDSITNTTSIIIYSFEVPSNVAAGMYQNASTVFSDEDDTIEIVEDSVDFTVINSVPLTLSQNVNASPGITNLSVGDIVTYTITISNGGPSDIVPGTATITNAFTTSPIDSASLRLRNITSEPTIPFDISSGTLFDSTPVVLASNFALVAEDALTLTLEFIIDDVTAYPVNITNTVGIDHPDATTPASARITDSTPITIVSSPPIIDTMVSKDTAQPGEIITYTISISRAGSVEFLSGISETISIKEELPNGLTYIGSTDGIIYDSTNNHIIYSGEINGTTPFYITYSVIVSDTAPGTILQSTTTITTSDRVYESSTTISVPDLTPLHTLVLVYAGGDNNLDMDRLHNNLEMNADNPYVTTLLVIDGPSENDAYLYRIQHDTDPSCPHSGNYSCSFINSEPLYELDKNVWTWPENTGSPHNLAGFIKGAMTAYPKNDQVILVLAGHGNGWAPDTIPAQPRYWDDQPRYWDDQPRYWDDQYIPGGMISDENPGDALSTYEFSTALDWAYAVTEKKLDLIYMDACSMQMSEVAYEVRNYADYLLGSENTTWASFAYDAHLADIDETTGSEEIARRWLKNEAEVFRSGGYPFTLSIVDLEKMEAVLSAEDVLAQALMDELVENFDATRSSIQAALADTELFESDYNGKIVSPDNDENEPPDNYGDLYSFAQQIESQFNFNSPAHSDIRNAAVALQTAVTNAVVLEDHQDGDPWPYPGQFWSWGTIGGLSKYLHFNLDHDEPKRRFYNGAHLASAQDGLWDDLIDLYWNHMPIPTDHPVCPNECDGLGGPLPLRPEVASPSYWSDFNNVPLFFDPSGGDIVRVEFNFNLANTCLAFDGIDAIAKEELNGFEVSASYADMTLTATIVNPSDSTATLPDARIATVKFDASACLPGTSTELTFASISTELNGDKLDEVIATSTVEIPVQQCDVFRDNADTDDSVVINGDNWVNSTAVPGFHGSDYLHNNNTGTGSVKFKTPRRGTYEVFIRWSAHLNRATNTPIDVVHTEGTKTFEMNQQENGGKWISLGTYIFGNSDYVEIRADGTDGHVAADAVRFQAVTCSSPRVSFSPTLSEIGISERITVEVYASNVNNLYGVTIEASYDPNVVDVVDINNALGGINILPGSFFSPDTIFLNSVDAATGKIRYTASLQGDKPGVSGSGPIAHIFFQGLNFGTSSLTFDKIELSDPQSADIDHTHIDGEIQIPTEPDIGGQEETVDIVDIVGQVTLPRRGSNNNDGATVCVDENCVMTDEAGSYALNGVSSPGKVLVTHPSYLHTTYNYSGTDGETITLPGVTLLGGDYNQAGVIDIKDAVLFGMAWESTPTAVNWNASVDVTDDSEVEVFDLVAVQNNWHREGPSPWSSIAAASRRNTRPTVRLEDGFDPNSDTLVSTSPANLTLVEGATQELEIRVDNVSKLYGFTVEITFDPAVLQVRDADPVGTKDIIEIIPGDFLDVVNQFVIINRVDNEKGIIELSMTQRYPAESRSGSGVLGKIPFEVVGKGSTDITLYSIQLVDDTTSDPQVMPANKKGSTVTSAFMSYLPTIVR